MGEFLADTDLRIDRIVSSTAARAQSTARLFRQAFDNQVPLTSRRDLYHADAMALLAVAREEAESDARILLVGHNPGMHDLALFLSDQGDPKDVDRLRTKFPTGALAEFECPAAPIEGARAGTGRLLRFVRPKDLPGARTAGL